MRLMALVFALSMLSTPVLAQPQVSAERRSPREPGGPAPSAFRVGIEDVLRIAVWGEPGLDTRVRVRPDGKISLPLIDEIDVVGLTPQEIGNEVTARLSRLIREPRVAVIVEEINSFRVYVLGEVARQGPLNFSRPTRLLQAIASAGGLTEFSKKEIVLLREVSGIEQRIRLDYKRLVAGDPTVDNIYLRPGDTILVE